MYSNDDDLDEYVQEAKNELTKVRNDAWASFQEALLVECVKNEHWNVKVRGQPPQSRHDVLNIVTSKQWVDKVGEKVAETTVAHLTVGMFQAGKEDWVRKAEATVMKRLHIAGYEKVNGEGKTDANLGKGCIFKVSKEAVSKKWKTDVAKRMQRNVGWFVGSKLEAKSKDKRVHTEIDTQGGYVAYKVKDMLERGALDEARDSMKTAVENYLRMGGEVSTVTDEAKEIAERLERGEILRLY